MLRRIRLVNKRQIHYKDRMAVSNPATNTTDIEASIAQVREHPNTHHDLIELLTAVARRHDQQPKPSQLNQAAQFVLGYLEQVPYMLKVALTAARNVGLDEEMYQVVNMVQSYWKQDEDIIPDHLGVFGLLDDAYCSLTTLQTFSDQYQRQTGKHMFPEDLTAANRVMRTIIGAPYARQLDVVVDQAIDESGVMVAVKALASEDKHQHLAANANIWNHGPAGEMSVEQLRGLGIIDVPEIGAEPAD